MRALAFVTLILGLSACAHKEPIDESRPFGGNVKISSLSKAGWSVSKPLSIEQIEEESLRGIRMARIENPRIPDVPFGFSNAEWIEFKKHIAPGDELIKLSAPRRYWEELGGWAGYVIVRNGEGIREFTTLIN